MIPFAQMISLLPVPPATCSANRACLAPIVPVAEHQVRVQLNEARRRASIDETVIKGGWMEGMPDWTAILQLAIKRRQAMTFAASQDGRKEGSG